MDTTVWCSLVQRPVWRLALLHFILCTWVHVSDTKGCTGISGRRGNNACQGSTSGADYFLGYEDSVSTC